jgi:hypothetical protein
MSPASRKTNTRNPTPKAILRLTESANRSELVAVIGTGVSISLTKNKLSALNWKGLIVDGFEHAKTKGKITDKQFADWEAQRSSDDLDDLLAAAEFVGRKLDSPRGDLYARWLENVFKGVQPSNRDMARAIKLLCSAGIPLVTLNYDSLLESVTGQPTINLTETAKVGSWMRRESTGILHLHGTWDVPRPAFSGFATTKPLLETK